MAKKNEVLLETCYKADREDVLYQITRDSVTGEYYFYATDDGALKKKAKSYSGAFEKEKNKIETGK